MTLKKIFNVLPILFLVLKKGLILIKSFSTLMFFSNPIRKAQAPLHVENCLVLLRAWLERIPTTSENEVRISLAIGESSSYSRKCDQKHRKIEIQTSSNLSFLYFTEQFLMAFDRSKFIPQCSVTADNQVKSQILVLMICRFLGSVSIFVFPGIDVANKYQACCPETQYRT